MSLAEAVTNTVIGYLVAVGTNFAVLPLFGFQVGVAQSFGIGLVFTVVSTARSYLLRRVFERFRYDARAQA